MRYMASLHSNILLHGVRKRLLGLVSAGIQNIWLQVKGKDALERLRFILRYDADDFSDVLNFGGLLTSDGKFKMSALIKGTMLDIKDRTFHSSESANERWIRFVGDRSQSTPFATAEYAKMLNTGRRKIVRT